MQIVKPRLIVVAVCLLVVMPRVAVGQTNRAARASIAADPAPLLLHGVANTSTSDEVIARLFAFQPAIPLGPVEVLEGYEDGMNLIVQRLSADLTSIAQANWTNQITRVEAEYLIQERYRVAMMQHEVLSALHASLKHDLDQATKRIGSVNPSDTTVVVQAPLPGQVRAQ